MLPTVRLWAHTVFSIPTGMSGTFSKGVLRENLTPMGAGPTGNVAGQGGEESGRAADYPEAALVPGKGCASPCPHTARGQPLPLGTLTERSMTSLALSWTEMVTS